MATKEINPPIVDTKTKNGKVTPINTANGASNGSSNDYNADSIKVLGGMEAVRKRPAMYIGSTGELGLHHLVYEVVDNSVDEALAGFATKIEVTIHLDNSITVIDDGRGIPVDDMVIDGEKVSAAQVVMTTLHAGGKFDSSTYKVSGGLHGVGVSCVNALSEELELEIWRDGATWQQNYSKGDPTNKLHKTGVAKVKTGTKVHFLPDRSIFTVVDYNYDTLAQRLRELAFLNKGLLITLTDERNTDSKTGEAKHTEFKYNGGIAEFIKHLNRGKQVLHDKPIYMEAERSGVAMEIGLQYNDDEPDRPRKRAEPAEDGDVDGEPVGDHARPSRGDAEERHPDPQQAVRHAEDERLGLRVVEDECAQQQREVHARMAERDDLESTERDHASEPGSGCDGRRHQLETSSASRRSGSSASAGQLAGSVGHQANSSCSSSGVTVAPSASHAWPISSTSSLGSSSSASMRIRSGTTDHSSRSSRPSVSAGFSSTSTDPPAPSAHLPAQDASHGARRPASQRPSAARTMHWTDRLWAAPAGTRRSAHRAGWSSSDSRSDAVSKPTSRAASPSWLGDPRRRSASSATSAASVASPGGSNGSSRQATAT